MTPASATSAAAAGGEVVLEAVVLQRVELAGNLEDDVAAAPTVAALPISTRHELFAAEAQGTGATVPTLDEDLDAIREHQDPARPGDLCPTGLDGFGEHGDFLAAVPRSLEADHAVDQREQGVVAPHADVGPGKDRRAPLAKQDGAGIHRLTRGRPHSRPAADAVASVP